MYELTNWVLSSSIDEEKQAKKTEFTRKDWDLFIMTEILL